MFNLNLWKGQIFKSLKSSDNEVVKILNKESKRQLESLELIASENFTSKAVLEANGTIFTNKYSEGYPNKRYYGGNEYIDELELLTQKRALKAFNLDEKWHVNVQSYSGSPANFSVYTALLNPGDIIMGLDLFSGGHLTHGFQTVLKDGNIKKISNSSIYFTSKSYSVSKKNFLIDYDVLEKQVLENMPKLIIVGASAYPRDFDYKRFKKIANLVNAYLMCDMAHTSGLIASGLLKSPFDYCDIITTTTHKTLRGPRAALIFCKNKFKEQIDFAVFPSSQGGPHNNTISAIATALKQVNTVEFKEYSKQVVKNAQYLSSKLIILGFDIITGGTDNHIVLVNLKNKSISGAKFEKIAELCNMSVNKNTIATDSSAMNPSGIRLGTSAMTTRGFKEKEIDFTANCINEITELIIKIQKEQNVIKLVEFMNKVQYYEQDIIQLKNKIKNYCKKFPLPN
jgi:glycine hydroxymethyltransferase